MKKILNIKNVNIFCRNKMRGIAMVEALMAISIIILSVMAPLTLLSQSAKYTKFALNKITATSLAEEQIELMINFKKSLDIYCFNNFSNSDNLINCEGNSDGFDTFVSVVNDISVNCTSYPSPGNPCYVDDTSFTYVPNSKPTFLKKASCKIYEEENDTAKCSPTSTSKGTVFLRKLYIDNLDQINSLTSDTIDNTIRLTSVVCINKTDCNTGDGTAVTLIYYIYR